MKKLSNPLFILIVLTYLLIVWGGVVRTTGSGLGCPDWPLCHGQWIPPFEKAVLIEYFHRLLASLVGLLTLGICLRIWTKPDLRNAFGKRSVATFVLLLVQIGLGGVTVKTELHPYIVVTHLAVALVFLTLIFNMTIFVLAHGSRSTIHDPRSKWYFVTQLLLFFVSIQILFGGMVAASNGGLVCPDFPTCNGLWLPSLQGLVAWQFFHRVVAFLVLGVVLILAFNLWHLKSMRGLFALVCLQMGLGIANVLLQLPLWIRVAHLGVAVLIFLMVMVLSHELRTSLHRTH